MTVNLMIITFLILLITIFLFMQGKYRPDLISIASLTSLTLFGVLTPEEALTGFSNTTVIMLACLFIIGAGVLDSGLAKYIGNTLLRLSGSSEKKASFIIFVTVSLFSAVLSNTGAVAFLLPAIISLAFQLNMSPSRLLLPLTFASSLGGLLTLIGTPSNFLQKGGYEKLGFFDLTGIGVLTIVAGVLFMFAIGFKLLPNAENVTAPSSTEKSMSAGELAGLYKIYDQLHFVYVPEGSEIVGERLADLKLSSHYEITVIEIERKTKEKLSLKQGKQSIIARAGEVIYPHDLLLVFGETEQVEHFIRKYELQKTSFDLADVKSHFLGKKYGMTEILIAPHSRLAGQTIVDIHFREKYSCNVLAINRKGDYYLSDFANKTLKLGDALLVHGKWENIEMISKNKQDTVVLGSIDEEMKDIAREGKATVAAGILGLMLLSLAFNLLSPLLSLVIAAFLMIVSGCIQSREAMYQRINWESVVLLAMMLPMATALQKTGGIQYITNYLLDLFGGYGPFVFLLVLYVITAIFSQFMSNIVTAVLFAPIAINAAFDMGISPYPLLVCVTVATCMSFATPIASPTNALVMTAGGISSKDLFKIGLPLQVFVGILVVICIPYFFPF